MSHAGDARLLRICLSELFDLAVKALENPLVLGGVQKPVGEIERDIASIQDAAILLKDRPQDLAKAIEIYAAEQITAKFGGDPASAVIHFSKAKFEIQNLQTETELYDLSMAVIKDFQKSLKPSGMAPS